MHIAVVAASPTATIDPAGLYAEDRWLPILGPTAWLLGRRASQLGQGESEEYDDDVLAAQLGVSASRLRQAAARLAREGLAEWWPAHGALTVAARWEHPRQRHANRVAQRAGLAKAGRLTAVNARADADVATLADMELV